MPKAKERDGVYQRADRAGWWVSYVDAAGKRHREKVEAYTRTQAVEALRRIRTAIERNNALGIRPDAGITTAELFERFKRYQRPRIAAKTFERLEGILETLLARLPATAKDIAKSDVSDFVSKRLTEVKAATVSKELFTLHKVLRLAVEEWELLNQNPAAGVKVPKQPDAKTRYLTPGELKAVLEACPVWMRAPIALSVATGTRRGELLALRWFDVDLERRLVTLRGQTVKNREMRILRLNEPAMQVLRSLPQGAPGDLLFPDVDAQRLTVYTRRIFARLGIQDASFHTLRHTFGSLAVMEGANLYAVGQLLGHKTPRMTQRYAHLSPDYQAATAGKLDGVLGGIWPALPEGQPEPKTACVSHRSVTGKFRRKAKNA